MAFEKQHIFVNPKTGKRPDLKTTRSFLRFLAGLDEGYDFAQPSLDFESLASWLVEQGIGPLAYARCQNTCPDLAALLQMDAFSATAENSMHWQNLNQIDQALAAASIPAVLLKGAALAEQVYGTWDRRTMSDIDLWLQIDDIPNAVDIMRKLGFYTIEKDERPLSLQMMAGGEIQFLQKGWTRSLAEFHISPYSGWWLKRTALIDDDAIWSRKEMLPGWHTFYQLSAEDTILQVAVHLAVNHQCGFWAIRSLMDLALTIQNRKIDWEIVIERAQKWRISNAIWLVLYLLHQLFLIEALEPVLNQLAPPLWRRKNLTSLVSPESLILSADIRSGRKRFLFLLLLVDRTRDMMRLTLRTLWPEKGWLSHRYGSSVNHWQHLHKIIREGQL